MARTVENPPPAAVIAETINSEHRPDLRTGAVLAAHIVARIGTHEDTAEFINAEDFAEIAPQLAHYIASRDADRLSDADRAAIHKTIDAKLTKAEWRQLDHLISDDNFYALCMLEAGVLIGVALERARNEYAALVASKA